jgi:hypothetical protein
MSHLLAYGVCVVHVGGLLEESSSACGWPGHEADVVLHVEADPSRDLELVDELEAIVTYQHLHSAPLLVVVCHGLKHRAVRGEDDLLQPLLVDRDLHQANAHVLGLTTGVPKDVLLLSTELEVP